MMGIGVHVLLWIAVGLPLLVFAYGRATLLAEIVLTTLFIKRTRRHDAQVAELLGDGTCRLLSIEWLKSTPLKVLPRSQELPAEAFVPAELAKELYLSKRRRVAVLSCTQTRVASN